MANSQFQHETFTFNTTGMNLADPVDKLPPGKHRLLVNTRVYTNTVQGRFGLNQQTNQAEANPVHSIFSWNDPIESPTQYPGNNKLHCRMAGIDTKVYIAASDSTPTGLFSPDTGYSGKQNTFIVANSGISSRPQCYVGDFNKNSKFNSASQRFHMGVAPPNFAPTTALSAVNANGPDVGTTGLAYVYRFVARTERELNTGCTSSGGPAQRVSLGLSPAGQNITVTLPQAHPDPQVSDLDVYRYGGSLPVWKFVGSIINIAGRTMEDIYDDASIAANQELDNDNNQPWMSVDITRQGVGTITSLGTGLGCTLTITSGDTLKAYDATGDNPFYPAGQNILIDGTLYALYRSPDSTTVVELLEDHANAAGVSWQLTRPEIMHQPLPFMWGPFGGGATGTFVFACGDPLRPGALYWTKGNQPESHPATNILDVTSGSEFLQNGVIFNGSAYVFSSQRMFAIYPNLGGISDFLALEVPNSIGLIARWGICTTPFGIAFVGKDGVYLSTGGAPINLTDDDLYPIFPHEVANTINRQELPDIDGNVAGVYVPNMAKPDQMHLAYGDGHLYFDFEDTNEDRVTLVGKFDMTSHKFLGWVSYDVYNPSVHTHFFEVFDDSENQDLEEKRVLMGLDDGSLADFGGSTDYGNDISCNVQTGSYDFGDSRPRKLIGDIEFDINSECIGLSVKVGFDNFTYLSTLGIVSNFVTGRHREIGDINSGEGQYSNNVGLFIEWVQDQLNAQHIPVLYSWMPSWLAKTEVTVQRVTDWDDGQYFGAKFVQGFILHCDTLAVPRQIAVESDGGIVQETFTVSSSNEQELAFSFATPFISHFMRLHPQDLEAWRIFRVRWIYNIAPELTGTWQSQETTHDFPGWWSHRDLYLPFASASDLTLTVACDGNPLSPFTYTIPNSGGASTYTRAYKVLQAMKCKAASYKLVSSTGLRLFLPDVTLNVKPWGAVGPYAAKRPFGDISRNEGAKI